MLRFIEVTRLFFVIQITIAHGHIIKIKMINFDLTRPP